MLNALNEVLRDDFIKDSVSGISRWNKVIEKAGLSFRLSVPHKAFNRQIGTLSGVRISPDGELKSQDEWVSGQARWLPTADDRAFVASLMKPEMQPGHYASWISAPTHAINKQPLDLEYVRFS
jgi:benzoyl-CoA 2,3-epoxidase subunit B